MKKLFKTFANLELAIFLLLIIAFFSALGSIVEQDKAMDFYKSHYSFSLFWIPAWQYLQFFELDHIYTAWWFFGLLLLFGFCLLSCTFLQQFPALKFARRYYFYTYKSQFKKLKVKFFSETSSTGQLCFRLMEENYSIFQKEGCFYGYKGLIGRIGPVIVHLSIICILVGSILGAYKGFSAQEFVPKSEIFHVQNLVKSGYFSKVPQKSFRVNDFWVNYTKLGLVKQYQSDISLLSGQGSEVIRKTISVNNPLLFEGLTLYQTDWGVSGVRLKLSTKDSILQLPVSKLLNSSQKLWISWLPLSSTNQKGILLVFNTSRGKVDLYTQEAQWISQKSLGQWIGVNEKNSLEFIDFILSTGIQIKTDPGIPTIYTGFAFLMVSSFISYISFSEIWFLQTKTKLLLGGRSNRAKTKFKMEVLKLQKVVSKLPS